MTKSEGIYFSFLLVMAILFIGFVTHREQNPSQTVHPPKIVYNIVIIGKVVRKYEIIKDGNTIALVDVLGNGSEKIEIYSNVDNSVKKNSLQIQANLEENKLYTFFIEDKNNSNMLPNIISATPQQE